MVWNSLDKFRDAGLLILRLGFGLGFTYYHGWSKLIAGPERWESLGGSMSRMGIEFWPTFWGFMMAFAESIGGIMIAVGFLFRPICLMLGFGMFVAWLGHVVSGNGTPAHAFKNMAVLLGATLFGPGAYSVDAWLSSRRKPLGRP
jgi:putative oxidoreductase